MAGLPFLPALAALPKNKRILREAARLLRSRCLAKKRPNDRVFFPIALAVSRAVWRKDKRIVGNATVSTEFGKNKLELTVDGAPELLCAHRFAEDYALAMKKVFSLRKEAATSLERSRLPALRRKCACHRQLILRE